MMTPATFNRVVIVPTSDLMPVRGFASPIKLEGALSFLVFILLIAEMFDHIGEKKSSKWFE